MTAASVDLLSERRQSELDVAGLKSWRDGHEKLCSARDTTLMTAVNDLKGRLGRLEKVMIGQAASIIAALAVVAWALFKFAFHVAS